jgi:hypothetical protein
VVTTGRVMAMGPKEKRMVLESGEDPIKRPSAWRAL